MKRQILIEAEFDRPVDLQVVQGAAATWNGENIELTLNLVLGGELTTLRAPIRVDQAQKFLDRLQTALNKANS